MLLLKTFQYFVAQDMIAEMLKLINNDISQCDTMITNQFLSPDIFSCKLNNAKATSIYVIRTK